MALLWADLSVAVTVYGKTFEQKTIYWGLENDGSQSSINQFPYNFYFDPGGIGAKIEFSAQYHLRHSPGRHSGLGMLHITLLLEAITFLVL